MLRNATNNILALHINGYDVLSIYMRGKLVWAPESENPDETILSCYFNGYWIDEYPWTDDTSWTD
jgi:hypothetical protein